MRLPWSSEEQKGMTVPKMEITEKRKQTMFAEIWSDIL